MAFSPTGKQLVLSNSDGLSVFSVNEATGALSSVPGSPFADASGAAFVTFSPTGEFLATANYGSDGLSMFSFNQASGALSPVPGSPFAAHFSEVVAFNPDGRLLATANYLSRHATAVGHVQPRGRAPAKRRCLRPALGVGASTFADLRDRRVAQQRVPLTASRSGPCRYVMAEPRSRTDLRVGRETRGPADRMGTSRATRRTSRSGRPGSAAVVVSGRADRWTSDWQKGGHGSTPAWRHRVSGQRARACVHGHRLGSHGTPWLYVERHAAQRPRESDGRVGIVQLHTQDQTAIHRHCAATSDEKRALEGGDGGR